jgi:hypothetical protein
MQSRNHWLSEEESYRASFLHMVFSRAAYTVSLLINQKHTVLLYKHVNLEYTSIQAKLPKRTTFTCSLQNYKSQRNVRNI